ncbi:MAG: YybH family protein [Solirubrobacteraceae bacterium]
MTTREQVTAWVDRYEAAWRSPGTEALRDVFSEDASYRQGPYHQELVGLHTIAAMWERERAGPDELFTLQSEVVAVEGDTAVVRAEVQYGDPPVREYRDLWVVRFDERGHAVAFEEWPFWPRQPINPDQSPPPATGA